MRRVRRAARRRARQPLPRAASRRPTARAITTIEGLAGGATLCTRCSRRSSSTAARSAASARRAWCWRRASLLERVPDPTEADDPRRARRQPLPLHRLHAHLRGGRSRAVEARAGGACASDAGFELVPPRSLDEALGRSPSTPGYRPFAGGTDLMVLLRRRQARPRQRYVDLWRARRAARHRGDAGRTSSPRRAHDLHRRAAPRRDARRELPMLAPAAAETGGVAIQNRGTIGGNIANASPAADSPPGAARLRRRARAGARPRARAACRTPRFHTGYKQTRRRARRAHRRASACPAADRRHAALPQGRHAPRAGDLQGVLRRLRRAADGRVTGDRASRSAASRPTVVRCLDDRGAPSSPATPIAAARRARRARSRPSTTSARRARYRRRVAENLLGAFIAEL